MPEVHLVADGLSFGYPGRPVLDRVGVSASAGDRVGVVGENGAGKTTLLRLLAGDLVPSAGEVRRAGSVSVVHQELDVPAGSTIGDLVARTAGQVRAAAARLDAVVQDFDHESGDLGAPGLSMLSDAIAAAERLAAWDVDRRVDEALTRFGAPRDTTRPLDTLSVGEAYRARLACHVAERADILLLDEPTNHLDAGGIDYLTAQLQQWPGVVLIVTHDRKLLDDVMTAILDLDPSMDGRPVLYGATRYADYRFAKDQALRRWRVRYAQERKRALQLAHRLDRSYEGLSDEWRPPKGSQKHRRGTRARIHVKAADRLVQKLEAEAVEVPVPPLELAFPDLPSLPTSSRVEDTYRGGPLLELRAPRVDGRLDLPGVRIELPPAGRLLITGPNGAGKSTLLAALAGRLSLDRGHRAAARALRLGVLAQDEGTPEHLRMTGFEAAAARALELLRTGALDPGHIVPIAALGLLDEADLDRPLAELSVGQRRRFALAMALVPAPQVLILDEPTNHLSIGLVDELTAALRVTSAAVVVATHDRAMRADLAGWTAVEL
ncbi:MAG TPA: ATP-binding cassette domain-containing protein [Cellulomonas sp.]